MTDAPLKPDTPLLREAAQASDPQELVRALRRVWDRGFAGSQSAVTAWTVVADALRAALRADRGEATWEHADLATETATSLRKHFDKLGGIPETLRLSKSHWQLIVLALEHAARPSEPENPEPMWGWTDERVMEWAEHIAALARGTTGWTSKIAWAVRRSVQAVLRMPFGEARPSEPLGEAPEPQQFDAPQWSGVGEASPAPKGEHMNKLVAQSDLEKIHDALHAALTFHRRRDEMNGAVHLAQQVRYSPLTSSLEAELDRVKALIEAPAVP